MINVREPLWQSAGLAEARRVDLELGARDLSHPAWELAAPVPLSRYWSGEEAPAERRAEARLLWSPGGLSVRFACRQEEPLVTSPEPRTDRKTIGLWERDVCEVFLAPDPSEPERYFEYEAAPTGEWLDLVVRQLPDVRETDWEYRSGMTAAAQVGEGSVAVGMRVPWEAFGLGRPPRAGELWRANFYRCVGEGPTRGYLAWQPTLTREPCFHVPDAFGWLEFKK